MWWLILFLVHAVILWYVGGSAACLRIVYVSLFKMLWEISNFDFVDTFSQFTSRAKRAKSSFPVSN
jgi:hypothetical protein